MAIMNLRLLTLLTLVLLGFTGFSQTDNFRFKAQLKKAPTERIAFAVKNEPALLPKLLKDQSILVKQVTPEYIYIQASPQWMDLAQKSGLIPQFTFEFAPPVALNDSTLVKHFVKPVHQGLGGLANAYTGKDVIIGYVDQGIDWTHEDFIDTAGNTRVLYYWDHNLPVDAVRTPMPYGYGQVWTSADIQAGTCGSTEESTAHGTSVAGAGSANGNATGREKGMAPDSKLIIIETNFNLPNWTLTVADACDFIFKKANELGLPAVVNLSVGTYFGSHDGNDPASVLIENLLDEQSGRIVVCAAGNAGAWGKYHVHDDVTADTSFVWITPNPGSQLGPNSVYLDVWSTTSEATWSYAFAANLPNGSFEERASTLFRNATQNAASGTTIFDTLWNNGNRIATMELYPSFEGPNFHLEVYFSSVDSTSYNISFKTTGTGTYDGWTGGTAIALNDMVTALPNALTYPSIVHYNLPDSLQTIVSSWNCSEKVVSVGNVRNRLGHLDKDGNYYLPAPTYNATVGQLSPNSSKGPSRLGVTKPNVTACGDVSLSAGPNWLLNDPAYNSLISDDGQHVRNGGTSMASPVVAGIAALFLEKCPVETYATFIQGITVSSFSDAFTGTTPNNAYGYGKINALDLLLSSDCYAEIHENTEDFILFPNPVVEEFSIEISQKVELIQVFDTQGKLVYSADYQNNPINVSSLFPGIYLVALINGNNTYWSKIIKK
jgi:hypothetical protein